MAGPTTNSSTARKKNSNRPNRAQLRAMEVRTAETVPGASAATVTTPTAVSRGARSTARRQVARAVTLSRAAEMQYIREDLRRLFYIAVPLFVLMIVLLLVID